MYSEHSAMFKDNPIGYIFFLALIPIAGLGLLLLLAWYVRTYFERLTIQDGRVVFETGVLSKDRVELSVSMIRAVRISQNLQQRLFGTGNVFITSSGNDPEIVARGMPDAMRIRTLLKPQATGPLT